MNTLGIIFPDQLYIDNPVLNSVNQEDFVLLYEPIDTFYEIAHHKHKLIFLIRSIRPVSYTHLTLPTILLV